MPKIRREGNLLLDDNARALLAGSMARRRLNQGETAKLISMKGSTLSSKIAHPNKFTLGELRELAKKLGWSAEEAGKLIVAK